MASIVSAANPRVKAAASLRQRQEREQRGRFLIEGRVEIGRALAAGVQVEELFALEGSDLPPSVPGVGTTVLGPAAFARIAYRRDGLVAVARRPGFALSGFKTAEPALVLVVEAIEKPGNLGAMIRSADAAGASVLVCDLATDLTNPNTVRASLGTLFTVPVAQAGKEEAIDWLTERGIELVAAVVDDGWAPWELDLTGPVAFAIGAEHQGLSEAMAAAARFRARIPMVGAVDSLNASAAAAIFMFEAIRQRRPGR
jgi:TrmH family RNA methyltransferase